MRVRAKKEVNKRTLTEFENQNLTPDVEYLVVGLTEGYFRIVDDAKEPVLYPSSLFDVADGSLPTDWVETHYEDGEWFADPVECASRGFYERWHDGDPAARSTFEAVVERLQRPRR